MIKRSEKEIRALYEKLRNESEVARELGVSRQSIYDYRIRHNIKYDPKKAKIKTYAELYADRNSAIVDMYLSDVPMDKICAKFGMNPPAVNYILTKYKVKRPAIHPSMKRNEEIFKLRQSGVSVKSLAERFGLNPYYVSTMIYKIKKEKREATHEKVQ